MKASAKGGAIGMLAGALTKTAARASCFFEIELLFGLQALGIVTPYATQGASLEKDCISDAATVVKREFLDIKDQSLHGYTEYL